MQDVSQDSDSELKAGKPSGRFDALDGLRGIAAIVVVLFHFRFFFPDIPVPPNGYLAVDLFFGLSGFVLVHAYGKKLSNGMTMRQFMSIRFVRLYPMYILGTAISVALISLSLPRSASELMPLVFAIFMAPSPITGQLYPLNVPAWSLFLELLVNVALVMFWKRLTPFVLLSICLASAAVLIICAEYYGGLDFGHRWEALAVGIARVSYSFFVGVALRLKGIRLERVPLWLLIAILLVIFMAPIPTDWVVAWDMFAVLIVFPALLAAGAYAKVGAEFGRLCKWSGEISYPLYAIHNPILVWCFAISMKLHLPITLVGALAIVLMTLLLAWLAEILFDKPIRSSLNDKRRRSR